LSCQEKGVDEQNDDEQNEDGQKMIRLSNWLRVAVVAVVPTAMLCQAQSSGKDTFTSKCVMCHADDGTGSAMGKTLKVPNLRSALVQKKSAAELTQVISQGKANMPAFGTVLNEDEIKEVIAYVRSLAPKKK
jgi:mono/diheme cytochrome c family protein